MTGSNISEPARGADRVRFLSESINHQASAPGQPTSVWTMRSATRNAAACFVGCVCFALLHHAFAAPPANLQPAAALQDEQEARVEPRPEYVPGEILVKFVENARVAAISQARRRIGAQPLKSFPSIGVALWKLPADIAVHRGIELLSAPAVRGAIEYAEPNYIYYISDFPSDPMVGELWGMHNIGQTGGTLDADIDAPEAWDFQTGSSSVVVGIIDTGIDYTHEDLAANMWINPGEDLNANGIVDETDFNGVDDDGNGFIDDLRGWNFVSDDNDPFDDHRHGTHTAGTVGAVGDNGIGVVGVNWTVQLMPLKFLNSRGSGTTDDAIDAILYAASFEDGFGNKIVRVTNNSWGGGRRSNALKQAIEASGALFVAAAGNSGSSRKKYPAGYDLHNSSPSRRPTTTMSWPVSPTSARPGWTWGPRAWMFCPPLPVTPTASLAAPPWPHPMLPGWRPWSWPTTPPWTSWR